MTDTKREAVAAIFRRHSTPLAPEPTRFPIKLNRIGRPRALLFDVYGTLFISASGDISLAQQSDTDGFFVKALQGSGFAPRSPKLESIARAAYLEAIHASHERSASQNVDVPEVDIREIWRTVVQTLLSGGYIRPRPSTQMPPSPALETHEYAAVLYESLANPTWPMPGAREALEHLRRIVPPLGIVSNAQFYTTVLFDTHFGSSCAEMGISDALCSWSFEAGAAKPSPAIFAPVLKNLADHYGIKPSEVVYVGNDMLNDIHTAQVCGLRTVLFAGDARSLRLRQDRAACKGLNADAVIDHWHQLPEILS